MNQWMSIANDMLMLDCFSLSPLTFQPTKFKLKKMGAPSCSHVFFSCALRCLAELASSPISLLCSITCGITRGRRTEDLPPGGFLDGERGSETSDFIPKTYKKHHERSFNYWVYMCILWLASRTLGQIDDENLSKPWFLEALKVWPMKVS